MKKIIIIICSTLLIGCCWCRRKKPTATIITNPIATRDAIALTISKPQPSIHDEKYSDGTMSPITPKYGKKDTGELKREIMSATTIKEINHLAAIAQLRSMHLYHIAIDRKRQIEKDPLTALSSTR